MPIRLTLYMGGGKGGGGTRRGEPNVRFKMGLSLRANT